MTNNIVEKNELSFEKAIEQLKDITTKLEEGNTNLDTSIELYQEGTKLIKYCENYLNTAQQKINKIVSKDNEVKDFSGTNS